jgi:ABC-2 type transport system ATP-binding protein
MLPTDRSRPGSPAAAGSHAADRWQPALRSVGLRHGYPTGLGLSRREVLHGIDLELAAGQRLGLVGPNGSGKSTLLRVVAGVECPTAGSLEVLGGSPRAAALRRRIGFLPEDSPFPRELKALEALELIASLRGVRRADAQLRSRALLELVGLAKSSRTRLGRFSRGMLRRFGLAQALVHEPDLVLLDEPTAGLDAQGFLALEELLARIGARGATLVLSSHLASDLVTHCDRLAVLIEGRLVAQGTPEEVLASGEGPSATQLLVSGLAPQEREHIARAVQALGGTAGPPPPSSSTLLEIYRRFERGDTGGGPRTSA